MGKKITQLATITEVADDDLIVGVDVSDTSGSDNGTNKKFTKATLLAGLAPLNPQLTGWNPDAETWVYHSVDDPTGYFKIEGKDVSANYSVGWRIMFTNGGNVIKGIITAITYSDPDTIITFLHEIDPTDNQALYLLTNSAITENYFSPHKAPLGFPLDPDKWSVVYTYSTTGNITYANPAVANTWYSNNNARVEVPIGAWKFIVHTGVLRSQRSIGTAHSHQMAISVNGSTPYKEGVNYQNYTSSYTAGGSSFDLRTPCTTFVTNIVLTAKTYIYLLAGSGQNTVAALNMEITSGICTLRMEATCAYL
jgi:hypothetical protein